MQTKVRNCVVVGLFSGICEGLPGDYAGQVEIKTADGDLGCSTMAGSGRRRSI